MSDIRLESPRATGTTTAVVRYGTPLNSTEVEFDNAVLIRIWMDGTLAVFSENGCTLEFARPETYWSFTWK